MAELATPPKPRRIGITIWMILSQILMLASLALWLLAAGVSVMAFDSGESVEAWTFVIAVWAYPLLPLALIIAAWIAYARRKNVLAGLLSGLSFAPPFACFLCVAVADFAWFAQYGGLAPFGK